MDKVFLGPAQPARIAAPRFSLGRTAGGSLAACLWLWTSAGALAAPTPANTAYRSAQESFNQEDYSRALTLLERAPTTGSVSEQADVFNLRGAIYLRQGRYEQAQAEFARASKVDGTLWAARFNETEVSFRQKRYEESRRRFAALLDQTSRLFHGEEYQFVRYKTLLAGMCAGDEKPALAFIADHRDDARPPLAWFYLNAALEQRQGRPQKGEQWLAQADARFGAGSGRTYAESFERLGWGTGRAGTVAGREARSPARNVSIADNTVTKAPVLSPRPVSPEALASALADSRIPPRTVAAMEILPESRKVSFRDSSGGASAAPPPVASPETPSSVNLPPGPNDAMAALEEIMRMQGEAASTPGTLARSRKGRATPTPAPSASATPDATPGVTANQGAAPVPGVGPAGPPSPQFTEKYEAAYVKFLEKNYPDTLAALDEADKVQPGQSQSISLRFKSHYALAYVEYRKQNYPGALAELDLADQTQKNADSFNLRGLVFSKQRNYDPAEGMFRKAIATDPALWAAKFNYAELPFNRGNYVDARTRFEELFSQTDAAKQPREAELTQYKVFLTLLLEGKVEAASTFMDHLNFSGATPARYFCNAALNFRAGTVDKAKSWIDDAKKEFPPQLVAIFIESFYRLGWMADPNASTATMVAQATPPGGTPAVVAALPSASPAVSAAAAASTPIVVAAASATPTPVVALPVPTATGTPRPAASPSPAVVLATPAASPAHSALPSPAASASPVIAAFTPIPGPTRPGVAAIVTPAPAVVLATPASTPVRPVLPAGASPLPAASVPPVVVAAVTPTASPAHSVALATATPRPTAPAPAVVIAATPSAGPARSVAAASVSPVPVATPSATAKATPAPTVRPADQAAGAATAEQAKKKNRRRALLLVIVLGQTLYYVTRMRRLFVQRKQAQARGAAARRETVESSK